MHLLRKVVVGVVLLMLCASVAHAQATRTWVSGVGDDANPCSRTAPCKTFAGAIAKTAAGGEISVLDPGGFGAVTITKSITIDGLGIQGSILASLTTGVIITAGANDQIILRHLSINGAGNGVRGIKVNSARVVYVEDCDISNFANEGIDYEPTGTSFLFVTNTNISNAAGGGILARTPSAGAVALSVRSVAVTNTRLVGNAFGLKLDSNVIGSSVFGLARETVAAGSGAAGFHALGSGTQLSIHQSSATGNSVGVQAGAGATVRMIDSASVQNFVQDFAGAGTVLRLNNSFP